MNGFARLLSLRGAWRDGRIAWRLLRDPRVPPAIKLVPVVCALYVLWPLDMIADAWPIIGQLDDVGVLWFGLQLFLRLAPRDRVTVHRAGTSA
jgi:uncharacterized membrane protein YkvA (DUF1232 family)